jgi:hypothetical protein
MTEQKMYNPLVQFVRGIRDDMPAFIDQNFGDYLVKVTPNDTTRRYDILPYFYSAYINFDLSLRIWNKRQLRNKLKNDTITYEWRLCSKDGKEVYHSDIGSSQYNKIVPFKSSASLLSPA